MFRQVSRVAPSVRLEVMLHPRRPRHAHTPAVLPLPLRLPTLVQSVGAAGVLAILGYAAARPMLGYFLSRYLNSSLSIRQLQVNPFTRRATLRNITLLDPHKRHLLSIPKLDLAYDKNVKSFPPKTEAEAAPHVLTAVVHNPSVSAIFDSADFKTSNWTAFTSSLPLHTPPPSSSPPSSSPPSPPSVDVRISVATTLQLGLSLPTDPPLALPPLKLTPPPLTFSTVTTPQGINAVIDVLTARALTSSTLPRSVRSAARKYARRALTTQLAESVRLARDKVKALRQGIESIDEMISDLPDVEGVRRFGQSASRMLRGVEGVLGVDKESGEETRTEEGFRELDEGTATGP